MSESAGWGYQFSCDDYNASKLPSFEMLWGDYWFEVLPEDYVVKINTSTNQCSLCLSGSSSRDYFIFGDVFLRGWYSIHDHDKQRMGFIPHTASNKKEAVKATTTPSGDYIAPPVILDDSYALGLTEKEFWAVMAIAGVIILFVLVILVFCGYMVPI